MDYQFAVFISFFLVFFLSGIVTAELLIVKKLKSNKLTEMAFASFFGALFVYLGFLLFYLFGIDPIGIDGGIERVVLSFWQFPVLVFVGFILSHLLYLLIFKRFSKDDK